MNRTFKYIIVIIFVVYFSMITNLNTVLAYTVDDLRDIVGKQRVDSYYTDIEIREIIEKYNAIEKQNLYVRMFKLGKEITIDDTIEDKIKEVEKKIEDLSSKLEQQYKEGVGIKEILSTKTQLETQIHEMVSLQRRGYYVDVEYKENIWSEEYKKVQEVVNNISQDYQIGDIGSDLKSPLYNGFRITSPFGFRIDPITKDTLTFHSGLDLGAPLDDYVFSLWNGIVSNVYETENGGKTIEIAHGPNLKTKYLHLNKIDVGIGQEVSQYDIIGGAGSTGLRSTGVHLHLEIVLDGENINPLYVFGNMGLRAFKEYISYNPARNRELLVVEREIKDKPTKEQEEELKVSKYYRPPLLKEGDIITYITSGTKEPEPFTYEIPIGLSKDEKELIEFIDRVIKKNEDKEDSEENEDNLEHMDIEEADNTVEEEENELGEAE